MTVAPDVSSGNVDDEMRSSDPVEADRIPRAGTQATGRDRTPRVLMLVSHRSDPAMRLAVRLGRRPCPEYLRLEERYGVELLDWSRLRSRPSQRSMRVSLEHTAGALRFLRDFDVLFSDGEHVGVPLALGMRLLRHRKPHLMLGHHLTTPAKRRVFRTLRPQGRITRILVHSQRQRELASKQLTIPSESIRLLPYYADTDFWSPSTMEHEPLVISAGREHRDYSTLTQACGELRARVFVATGSLHSPSARRREPSTWPDNFRVGFADHLTLREWYARASVVVVPLVPTDFQAGVTTIVEAMAMAKAVVVSATEGQRDIVEDGVTGLMVPPSDPTALHDAVARLLADGHERDRLGHNAREAVERHFSLDLYAARLAKHLEEIAVSEDA